MSYRNDKQKKSRWSWVVITYCTNRFKRGIAYLHVLFGLWVLGVFFEYFRCPLNAMEPSFRIGKQKTLDYLDLVNNEELERIYGYQPDFQSSLISPLNGQNSFLCTLPVSSDFSKNVHDIAHKESLNQKFISLDQDFVGGGDSFCVQHGCASFATVTSRNLYNTFIARLHQSKTGVALPQEHLDAFFAISKALGSDRTIATEPMVQSLNVLSNFPYNYPPAQELLGTLLLRGASSKKIDQEKGLDFLLRAALDGDNPYAYTKLAQYYRREPLLLSSKFGTDKGVMGHLFQRGASLRNISLKRHQLDAFHLVNGFNQLDLQFCSPEGLVACGDYIRTSCRGAQGSQKAFEYYQAAARLGSSAGVTRLRIFYKKYFKERVLRSFLGIVESMVADPSLVGEEIDSDLLDEVAALNDPEGYRALARYEALCANPQAASVWWQKALEVLQSGRINEASFNAQRQQRDMYHHCLSEYFSEYALSSKQERCDLGGFLKALGLLQEVDFFFLCQQLEFIDLLVQLALIKGEWFSILSLLEGCKDKLKSSKREKMAAIISKYGAGIAQGSQLYEHKILDVSLRISQGHVDEALSTFALLILDKVSYTKISPDRLTSEMKARLKKAFEEICDFSDRVDSSLTLQEALLKVYCCGIPGLQELNHEKARQCALKIIESGRYGTTNSWSVHLKSEDDLKVDNCIRILNVCANAPQQHIQFLHDTAKDILNTLVKKKNCHALVCKAWKSAQDRDFEILINSINLKDMSKGTLQFFVESGVAAQALTFFEHDRESARTQLLLKCAQIAQLYQDSFNKHDTPGVTSLYMSLVNTAVKNGSVVALFMRMYRTICDYKGSSQSLWNIICDCELLLKMPISHQETREIKKYHDKIVASLVEFAKKRNGLASYCLSLLYSTDIKGIMASDAKKSSFYFSQALAQGCILARLKKIANYMAQQVTPGHSDTDPTKRIMQEAWDLWRIVMKANISSECEESYVKKSLESIFKTCYKNKSWHGILWMAAFVQDDQEVLEHMFDLFERLTKCSAKDYEYKGEFIASDYFKEAFDRIVTIKGYDQLIYHLVFLWSSMSMYYIGADKIPSIFKDLVKYYTKFSALPRESVRLKSRLINPRLSKLDFLDGLIEASVLAHDFKSTFLYCQELLEEIAHNQKEDVSQGAFSHEELSACYNRHLGHAHRFLGFLYCSGHAPKQGDQALALGLEHLHKAADMNNPFACKSLGMLYANNMDSLGDSCKLMPPFNKAKAIEFLERAQKAGLYDVNEALVQLRRTKGVVDSCSKSSSMFDNYENFTQLDYLLRTGDILDGAFASDPAALFVAAHMYHNGLGVEQSLSKALSFYQSCLMSAPVIDDPRSWGAKALNEIKKIGIEKNNLEAMSLAVQFMLSSKELANKAGYFDDVSLLLEHVENVFRDDTKGNFCRKFFTSKMHLALCRVIDKHPLTCLSIQSLLIYARVIKDNEQYFQDALGLFVRAAFDRDVTKLNELDDKLKVKLFEALKIDNLPENENQVYRVGIMTLKGLLKIVQGKLTSCDHDIFEGLSLLDGAAKYGSCALYVRGLVAMQGEVFHPSIKSDYVLAKKCFLEAANRGYKDSWMALALLYGLSREGKIERHDFEIIKGYLEKAASLGHTEAPLLKAMHSYRFRQFLDAHSIHALESDFKKLVESDDSSISLYGQLHLIALYLDRQCVLCDFMKGINLFESIIKQINDDTDFDHMLVLRFINEQFNITSALFTQASNLSMCVFAQNEAQVRKDMSIYCSHLFGLCAFFTYSIFKKATILDEDFINRLEVFIEEVQKHNKGYEFYLLKALVGYESHLKSCSYASKDYFDDLIRALGLYTLEGCDASSDNRLSAYFLFDLVKKVSAQLVQAPEVQKVTKLKMAVDRIKGLSEIIKQK